MNNFSNKKYAVGIAGYMGCGKTTFAEWLSRDTGFSLINGDCMAKELMDASGEIKQNLVAAFGDSVICCEEIAYTTLGTIVFSDVKKLQQLNAIVHPVLLDSLQKTIFNDEEGAVIIDAALLPLWNIDSWFNEKIWIDASIEIRSDRIGARTELNKNEVLARIEMQQQLFKPPSEGAWTIICNEQDLTEFECAASRLSVDLVQKIRSLH